MYEPNAKIDDGFLILCFSYTLRVPITPPLVRLLFFIFFLADRWPVPLLCERREWVLTFYARRKDTQKSALSVIQLVEEKRSEEGEERTTTMLARLLFVVRCLLCSRARTQE